MAGAYESQPIRNESGLCCIRSGNLQKGLVMSIITMDDISIELEAMEAAKDAEKKIQLVIACIDELENTNVGNWNFDQFDESIALDQIEDDLAELWEEFDELYALL